MEKVGEGLVSKLDITQLERLRDIGTYLSDVRQQQSLTLDEISSHTYIPLRILRAIEAADDQVLPEPVFIQGFIRRYGDALGLDGYALSQEFPLYAQPLQSDCIDEDPLVNRPAPWQFPSLKFLTPPSPGNPSSAPNWPLIAAAALGAIAVFGLGYGLTRVLAPSENAPESNPALTQTPPNSEPQASDPESDPETAEAPVENTSEPEAEIVAVAQSANAALGSPAIVVVEQMNRTLGAPVTVDVTLSRRSWMQVVIDGRQEFEGIMEEQTQQTWLGQEEVMLLVGDAGAVSVSVNGSQPRILGENGSIAELTVTPEN
jgi:cytoskeleton protein RodZ